MREVILGTAGHVDHGKTSLVKALTGIDTDRLQEEKRRGITIELGFAFLDLASGHRLGIIDVPGHEKFVKHMVAGAAGIDLVAFVIAADEGIMPQTREHFEICRLLGVKSGLIVITKKDMVDPDWLGLVVEEVREFFAASFLAEAPLLVVSALTGEGIPEVRAELDRLVRGFAFEPVQGPFRLPVDRIFSMHGFGSVVTGTTISGRIGLGEEVMVFPRNKSGKVRGIQVHGQEVKEVEAGKRTAINIQGVEKEAIARGDIIATPGCLQPSYLFDADFLYLSGNKKPLKNRTRVRVHLGTAEIMGRILLLQEETVEPGATANVQLLLEEPAGAWPGDRYVVRSYSPTVTIGGGAVLNALPVRKRRRFKESNDSAFAVYHGGTPEELAIFHLREAGFAGLTFEELAVRTGCFGNKLKKILNAPVSARKILVIDSERQWMVAEESYEQVTAEIEAILAEFHRQQPMKPGAPKEELRSKLYRGLEPRLFQAALSGLGKRGKIVQDEAVVRLAAHRVNLQAEVADARLLLLERYRQGNLMPPTLKDLQAQFPELAKARLIELLEHLVRENELVKINDELYFNRLSLLELQGKLVDCVRLEGEINAQGFKALTGISRKYSIPLMEYFDKVKVTIRVGDKRILRGNPAAGAGPAVV